MISKTLTEVSWTDIEGLVELSREEDDTIEFKSAFKAGDDYLALNDAQRERSLDSLTREVLAFLNTRGGDIIVGIQEADAGAPVATGVTGIKNAQETADRIARGLAAVIEPAQTNVAVRAITNPADQSTGVLVIRAQPSLRAPHRSKRTRECYSRRGTESVPMAMDEIQDVTISRTRLRLEQEQLLEQQFADFVGGRSDHQLLTGDFVHVRVVVQPLLEQELVIDDQLLAALGHTKVCYYDASGREGSNDVAFRDLSSGWKPFLRGQKRENYQELVSTEHTDFHYACKRMKQSGIVSFDFAGSSHFEGRQSATLHFEWLVGFFAEICRNLISSASQRPTLLPATLRVGIHASGDMRLSHGRGMRSESREVPAGFHFVPDFTIENEQSVLDFFEQIQIDVYALVGLRLDRPFSLRKPEEPQQGLP